MVGVTQVKADTDKTSSVSTAWKNSGGSADAGTAASSAAPYVTPYGSGSSVAMYEAYNATNTAETGTLLQQTVTGLENGTYRVEFYANAIHANNVTQSAPSYTNARVYVFANTQYKQVTPEEKNTTTQNGEYTINNVVVSDGTLKLGLYKHSAGTNWHTIQIKRLTLLSDVLATNASSLMNASEASPIDATDFLPVSVITNSNATGWTFTGGGRNYSHGVWEVYNQNYTLQQTLSNMPNGRYVVKVQGFYRAGGGGTTSTAKNAKLFANGVKSDALNILDDSYASKPGTGKWSEVSSKFVPNDREAGGYAFYMDEKYKNNSVTAYVTNNTLNLGLEKTVAVGSDWSLFNGFEIKCTGIYLSAVAQNFTSGSTMEAGQWYKYTVPTDGDYTFSATDGIVYSITDAFASDTHSNVSSTTALPAGTVYIKSNTSQTLTISYVDPVVENGDYYLYDATNKVFLSRGANFGARATVDKYGVPFTWNNYSKTIVFKDWTTKELFFDQTNHTACWLYTDQSNKGIHGQFSFEEKEGSEGYYYLCDKVKAAYITHDNAVLTVPSTTSSGAAVWQVLTKAERDAIVNAYPTDNKTNVIAAASLTSETDAASFETWLAANRAAKDKTDKVGTARFTKAGGKGAWTVTGSASYGDDWTEGFQNAVTWEQTINELAPGIYKVTVNGFERKAGYELCNTLAEEGYEPVTAYFKANDEQLPLASWFSDKTGTNNPDNTDQAATAFNNDKYKNIIYTYVEDAGEGTGSLTLTIKKQDKATGSWVLFNNVTLTYYDTEVSDEERTAILSEATATMASPMKASLYQALATAKSTFEGSNTVPNYNALRTAIDNCATSIASYANMHTNYIDPLNTYFATTNFVQSDAYNTYLGYKDAYDNYTDAETADVENAVANSLSITKGNGTNYTSTYSLMMLPNWTKNGTAALDNSGFYVNTWSNENKGTGDAMDFANPFYEYWVGSGSLAEATIVGTMTGLKANQAYDVTANVRVLGDSKVAGSITMEVEGGIPVDVTAGDAIMDGETPTGRYIKSYTATGVTDADGKLELKFNVAANSNISWLSFRDINCAESEAAISNDFTELNSAISTAEAHTLGFESGEYAPYNNVDALNKLEAAKNLDQNHYYIPSVISSTATTLSDATWTDNDGEVNAFYKGDFDGYTEDTTSPLDYTPNGWTATANFRMMIKNVEDYPGLADASAGTAAMSWSGGITYGETAGYTMPLKANTVYRLQFKAAGWNNETRSGMSVSILNSTDGMALYNLGTPDRDIKGNATNTAGMTSYDVVFATGAAGNYVFHIQSGNNMVVTDFSITKAASQTLTFADNAAMPTYAPGTYPSVSIGRALTKDNWSTLVVPVNMNIPDGWSVKEMNSFTENTLEFKDATSIEAGKPYMVKANSTRANIEASNVEVTALTLNPVTNNGLTMKGVYEAGTVPVSGEDATRYIVSGSKLHKVTSDNVSIKPFRAYFELVDGGAGAREIILDFDGVTAINAIEAANAKAEGLKDGKYLIGNKIVLVKNGVKYGANGQKLN